jgi:hypothetical protein
MTAALQVPLLASAILFAGLAVAEWRRAPVWGRVHLAVATAFALAAAAHPGMSIKDALDGAHDGMAYVVGLARGAGIVAGLVTVATRVRDFSALR